MNICLLPYNNYFNRKLKRLETWQEYANMATSIRSGVNFNPNDDILTTMIWGQGNYIATDRSDYAVVADRTQTIISRWFVIEKKRTREGQFEFTLLRDVLADFYDFYKNAPMLIEKATAATTTPFIYNKENFSVNQIKTNETLLKDKSGCPWIVGYLAQNTEAKTYTTPTPEGASGAIQLGSTLEAWEYYRYITTLNGVDTGNVFLRSKPTQYTWIMEGASKGLQGYRIKVDGTSGDVSYDEINFTPDSPTLKNRMPTGKTEISQAFRDAPLTSLKEDLWAGNYVSGFLSDDDYNELMNMRNSKVISSDGKVYQIDISIYPSVSLLDKKFSIPSGSALNTRLNNLYKYSGAFASYVDGWPQYIKLSADNILIIVNQVAEDEATFTIPAERQRTMDSQYDIFCMPYGEVSIYDENGALVVERTDKDMAMAAYSVIQEQAQTFLYDIQLLPFCPCQDLIQFEGSLRYKDASQFAPITSRVDNTVYSGLFFVSKASFSFNIPLEIHLPPSSIERKIVNQCDKYRLCSPNYSTFFDFNPNLNGDSDFFEVDCYYKPYSPYIHICPEFGNLYGGDFNDPRGLILGGDFSLSQITDQWQLYQINNKNYNEIFRAGIENLETQYDIARTQGVASAIAGTGQGMALGGMVGGIPGMVVGGIASGIGGIVDQKMNEELRQQQLLYTNQIHEYSLQNIQALPHTLSKVDSFTPNNKVFPVLEYYTCLPEEKLAFANMLKYEGMTIGAISTFENFMELPWEYTIEIDGEEHTITDSGFIRGQLIQIPTLTDDSHLAVQIAKELKQGVYTK